MLIPVNRLASQTSPYLLQHRHNPVDWFPWGEEAFAEARRRDVPIFLSIGYSTCYWCHVMERESFENAAIAAKMNAAFVCVKVDREERPDVDDVYMAAVQAFSGRGGWPMSVFLEPRSLKPFWAGTYFPAEPKFQGMPTFPHVLDSIAAAWRDGRSEVLAQAEHLADAVRERVADAAAPVRIGEAQITQAVSQLLRLHDPIHGGFGPAPKFPQPAFLDLLLAVREAAADEDTRRAIDGAVGATLTRMALGGIFDQVGGGFHRYSVDAQWLVPHFEKMLYDNGQLAETYARAAGAFDSSLFSRTSRRVCEYVLREMTSPEGAFYSAQDAEVNHREGQNYLWTRSQLVEALGEDDGAWAATVYGVAGGPNFRDPHHPTDPAANVLCLSGEEDVARLDRVNARLHEARSRRDQPGRDDKIIAGWNGLMIAGLAATGRALGEARFIDAAALGAEFVLTRMREAGGGLLRTFAKGRGAVPAFLEDYALVAHGLLALHEANPRDGRSEEWVRAARDLIARAEALFGDGSGGFFDTRSDQPDLFVRTRSVHDGAMPSGASVMINTYVSLGQITGDGTYFAKAARALVSMSGAIAAHPLGSANALRGLLRLMMADRGLVAAAFGDAEEPPRSGGVPETEVVEIMSAVDTVEVPADGPTGIVLKIRIAPGYHLTAAVPGEGVGEGVVGVVPFKVHIVSGGGVRVYADYPAGVPYGEGGVMRVYAGEFDLPIVLERDGEWTGTPLIGITYQPCTDNACLAARTVELDVALERG